MDILVFTLALLVMLGSLVFIVIPLLPVVPIIWLVFLGYGFYDNWHSYGAATMIVSALIMGLSIALDQLSSMLGARKFGAGLPGMVGAFVGAMAGLIVLNIPGLIIGTFAGAMLGEFIFGRGFKASAYAGTGALLGFLAGSLFKLIISLILIGTFVYLTFGSLWN